LSSQSQVKLLRFLENREYFPLGTDLPRRSEARIVAATNQNLESRAEEGRFRRDLLFRLSTYRVDIPPLRERREVIPLLCAHFLSSMPSGPDCPTLSPGALAALGLYSFPGNVRELRSLLLKAKALSPGQEIDRSVIDGLLSAAPKTGPDLSAAQASAAMHAPPMTQLPTIEQAIEDLIEKALKQTDGLQSSAAKLLGISPQALNQRLKHKGTGP
jgi:DNA-binding NtrC family response regulator